MVADCATMINPAEILAAVLIALQIAVRRYALKRIKGRGKQRLVTIATIIIIAYITIRLVILP